MAKYHFNRRAWNESYSGRTAKVGKPREGITAALTAAIQYATKEGAEINVLTECNVSIARVSSSYVQMSRSTLEDLLAEIACSDRQRQVGSTP